MKKSAQHRPQPLAIDQWVQAALTGELISVFRDDWLNLLKIGRLSDSLDQLRIRCRLPERSAYAATQFDGLLALHCVYYDAMSWTTRAGLPSALLAALGLDAHSGPQLLGPVGWQRLTHAYEIFAQPRQTVSASSQDRTNDVSDEREFQQAVASTGHKVRIQEATASALTKLRTAFASLRARLAFMVRGAGSHERMEVARSAPSHAALTELHSDVAAESECEGAPAFLSAHIGASEIATCPNVGAETDALRPFLRDRSSIRVCLRCGCDGPEQQLRSLITVLLTSQPPLAGAEPFEGLRAPKRIDMNTQPDPDIPTSADDPVRATRRLDVEREHMLSILDRLGQVDLNKDYTPGEINEWAGLDAAALAAIQDPRRKQFAALLIAAPFEHVYEYGHALWSISPSLEEYVKRTFLENEAGACNVTRRPLHRREMDFFRDECARHKRGRCFHARRSSQTSLS